MSICAKPAGPHRLGALRGATDRFSRPQPWTTHVYSTVATHTRVTHGSAPGGWRVEGSCMVVSFRWCASSEFRECFGVLRPRADVEASDPIEQRRVSGKEVEKSVCISEPLHTSSGGLCLRVDFDLLLNVVHVVSSPSLVVPLVDIIVELPREIK